MLLALEGRTEANELEPSPVKSRKPRPADPAADNGRRCLARLASVTVFQIYLACILQSSTSLQRIRHD